MFCTGGPDTCNFRSHLLGRKQVPILSRDDMVTKPKQRTNLSQDNKQNRGKETVAQGPAHPFLPRHRKGARAGARELSQAHGY